MGEQMAGKSGSGRMKQYRGHFRFGDGYRKVCGFFQHLRVEQQALAKEFIINK